VLKGFTVLVDLSGHVLESDSVILYVFGRSVVSERGAGRGLLWGRGRVDRRAATRSELSAAAGGAGENTRWKTLENRDRENAGKTTSGRKPIIEYR